jgi:hypothetical protein
MKHWLSFAVGVFTFPSRMNFRPLPLLSCAALVFSGCATVKVEPIEVKPIHITVDVNVKVDREVAGLLSDIYSDSATVKLPAPPAK